MTITVKHSKTNAIADWTQAQLDEQIDLGNFAPGTTLADIVLPSDWNNDHTFTGTLDVTNGGTGATTLTGYVKGSGTSALTASATIPNTDISGLGTISTQNANNVSITGGSINGTTIGATTASTGKFTDLTDTGLTSGRVTYATTGGNLTDSANLTFNGTTLTTTGVVTPSVTASSTDLTLSAISTGAVKFNTANGTQFQVTDTYGGGTSTNWIQASGRASNAPVIQSQGADTNITLAILSKGTGSISFNTNNGAQEQARVSHTASAVNYVQVTGGATGTYPAILGTGSDGTVGLQLAGKGGTIDFRNNGIGTATQFSVAFTASSVNYLNATGSGVSGNAPRLFALGTDTNISMAFQPKGTGAINLAAGSSGVNISNGGTVTAVTVTNNGSAYTSAPTWSASAPTTAGGVTSTGTTVVGASAALTINAGGTGYTVGNVLTVTGGTSTQAAQITVSAVSGGVITAATVTTFGQYSVVPTSPVSVTGGTGTGGTFTLTYFVRSLAIGNAGSGYIEQPTVTFSGGGGSGAAAYASVGSTPIVKSIASTLSFNNSAGEALRLNNANFSTLTDYVEVRGGASVAGAYLTVGGSTTNANLYESSKGTGNIQFYSNSFGQEQFRVSHTASAVNYVQVTGGATTVSPVISAQGSDTNVALSITSKGTNAIRFLSNGAVNLQFRIAGTNAAVNNLAVTGTVAGSAPILSAEGSDTNIDLALTPKGTGVVQFGTHTANADVAISGFITIRDAGGTLRKLAVIT